VADSIRVESDGTPEGTRVLVGDHELESVVSVEWKLGGPDEPAEVVLHLTACPRMELDRSMTHPIHSDLAALGKHVTVVVHDQEKPDAQS